MSNPPAGATTYIYFTTNSAAGAAVAPSSGFEVADVLLYKNGSATQRSSNSGWTMVSPFDSIVGLHQLAIDLSDNTDAGFYATGNNYTAVLSPDETIDSQTPITSVIGQFYIGADPSDVTFWNGTAVATPATAGVAEVNVKNINNVAATSVAAVNANVGTTQPVNFTGTGASALAKSDMVDIAGAAVDPTAAQVGAAVISYASGQTPLQPTVAGRTLDVTATGEAGIDWSNIGAPTTTVNLSGTSTKAVEPTVAGRTLDVSATGEAGVDWGNVGSPTTTNNLTGTSTVPILTGALGASPWNTTTVGDALKAAWTQGRGKWALSGTTLNIYAPDGTTVLAALTLDSTTSPTSRTP